MTKPKMPKFPKSANKTDLFAADLRKAKMDRMSDARVAFETYIDFAALAEGLDRVAPRPMSLQGSRPPFPTETMVRILFPKRVNNISDELMEYQLLDRMSYQCFCGVTNSAGIPDRTTVWTFKTRIGEAGAQALFDGIERQLLKHGHIARGGHIIDATLVPAPKQHFSKEDKVQLKRDAMPTDWSPAKRRQKDLTAIWTKKHGKSHHGYKLIRKIESGTAATHDSQHFETVLSISNTSRDVYADKGYPSQQWATQLKEAGYPNHIQRKGQRSHPLTKRQKQRSRRITQVRVRIEHPFASIAQVGGKPIRTIGQARANFAMNQMAPATNLKRLVYLKQASVLAF